MNSHGLSVVFSSTKPHFLGTILRSNIHPKNACAFQKAIHKINISGLKNYHSAWVNVGEKNICARRTALPWQMKTYSTSGKTGSRKLQLMDFPMQVKRNIPKLLVGKFRYHRMQDYDVKLSPRWFFEFAHDAIQSVSYEISVGDFESLEDFIVPEALEEIMKNWEQLDDEQREYLPVRDVKDFYGNFMYEVKFRSPFLEYGEPGEFTTEITLSARGLHDGHILRNIKESFDMNSLNYKLRQKPDPQNPQNLKWDYHRSEEYEELKEAEARVFGNMDNYYICNYRFTRRFGRYLDCYWKLDRVNHVKAKEYFSRPPNKFIEYYRFWYDYQK
ncbi:uncharacterized protein LOC106159041 [Lingula anatina]|uniref:Uncharacterized protein LOC106159041 n=1 Tax=Lingula anatina TaxID=7574 RepID=A0A1S3HXB1_LINAN|nr:uncharacterized protein LOC106159041 [Lingula anatina]|eukprot:XP_013390665.1 uncharacterized protein LOC106159041 [Lingula anatina]